VEEYFKNALLKIDSRRSADFKYYRRYDLVYDRIIDHLGTDTPICELGVGTGPSHARWSFTTSGKVIGLEISGPDQSVLKASKFDHEQNRDHNMLQAYEWYNQCMEFWKKTNVDMDQLDIRWATDGFDPAQAKLVIQDYPDLRLIINDSKHKQDVAPVFSDAWWPHMHPDAILVQEDFGVSGGVGSRFQYSSKFDVEEALDSGWKIIDLRSECNFPEELSDYHRNTTLRTVRDSDIENYSLQDWHKGNNCIGVKYQNPVWDKVFEGLKVITLDNWNEYEDTFIEDGRFWRDDKTGFWYDKENPEDAIPPRDREK